MKHKMFKLVYYHPAEDKYRLQIEIIQIQAANRDNKKYLIIEITEIIEIIEIITKIIL